MRLSNAVWKMSQNVIHVFSSIFLAVLKLESATHGMVGVFVTGGKVSS